MPPIMPPFYFVTQKLRGSGFSFPKATSIAKISSKSNFISKYATPINQGSCHPIYWHVLLNAQVLNEHNAEP